MNCAYHPDRPSVNTCSKCRQPVCAGCNYIAGKAPICRKCWEKIEHATLDGRSLPYTQDYAPTINSKPAGLGPGKTVFFIFLAVVVLSVGGFFTYRTFFPPPKVVDLWEADIKPLPQPESVKVTGESIKSRSHSYNVAGIPGSPNPSGAGELVLMTSGNLGDTWFSNYGDGQNEICRDLIQASDGGLVLCGGSYLGGNKGSDCLLMKTDKDGLPIWLKKWGGDGYQECMSIAETADSGLILCGSADNKETGQKNLLLTMTDADGKVLWEKMIGGQENTEGFCVRQVKDGGFIICGQLTPKGSKYVMPWVIKTDLEGKVLWENRFPEKNGTMGSVQSIKEMADGKYIGTGFLFIGSEQLGTGAGWEFFIDADGKFITDTAIAHKAAMVGQVFTETAEGDIAVAGYTYSQLPNDDTAVILLLSCEGKLKWMKEYSECSANSIVQASDGDFLLCGSSSSSLFGATGGSKMQLWINKTSGSGKEVWDCTGYTKDGEDISGMAIIKTSDGGYVLAGHLNIKKQSDIFLMKIYPDGQK